MGHLRIVIGAFCAVAAITGVVRAQPLADRASNVEKAAIEIAAIQERSGANGAFAAINACYKRELARAASVTRELEACMAQDIIISKVSAAFYASISAEGPRLGGAPEPDAVIKAMVQRVAGTFARFKAPQDDAQAFNRIVQTKGMEAFVHARFPR